MKIKTWGWTRNLHDAKERVGELSSVRATAKDGVFVTFFADREKLNSEKLSIQFDEAGALDLIGRLSEALGDRLRVRQLEVELRERAEREALNKNTVKTP